LNVSSNCFEILQFVSFRYILEYVTISLLVPSLEKLYMSSVKCFIIPGQRRLIIGSLKNDLI
jgi:hypothetical protein